MFSTVRTERFKSTFSTSYSLNWNKLGLNIQNSSALEIFKRALLSFTRPKPANVYKVHHLKGLKLLTRLRLGLLREHKFGHNFNDTIDPFYLCCTNSLETFEHFLLHYTTFASLRLFDNIHHKNILLLPFDKSLIVQMFLYGSDKFNSTINKIIITLVIDYIIDSKRFDGPLFQE